MRVLRGVTLNCVKAQLLLPFLAKPHTKDPVFYYNLSHENITLQR